MAGQRLNVSRRRELGHDERRTEKDRDPGQDPDEAVEADHGED